MVKCLVFSIIAGIFGTGLGGIVAIFTKKRSSIYPRALFFSGGFMLAMVSFELLPQAFEYGDVKTVFIGYVLGLIMIIVGNLIFEHTSKSLSANYKKAFLIMIAIALHNFPEGLAIGGGEIGGFGVSIMLLMLIHNIPEGLTVALPLIKNNSSNLKAVALSALSGVPTVLGAAIGYSYSLHSQVFISLSLSIAAGCMTYVTFSEILPDAFENTRDKATYTFPLIGFSLGLLFCKVV
ncbi:MAG: ZIP family metal transporter [Clostridia bacterium]